MCSIKMSTDFFFPTVKSLDGKMSSRKKTPFQKHREEEEAKKKVFALSHGVPFSLVGRKKYFF